MQTISAELTVDSAFMVREGMWYCPGQGQPSPIRQMKGAISVSLPLSFLGAIGSAPMELYPKTRKNVKKNLE